VVPNWVRDAGQRNPVQDQAALQNEATLRATARGVTEQQLRGAPKFAGERDLDWADAARNRAVDDY